ncbi:undecaprenyldiphospho-muramoylpentapeptide beta-N-acetylglucosaminyltransferase [Candidatus Parcubacteria bacterium]|nr:undecaprenyldiphospho-muramoylpentapeptide beta-N-acetylglucosaminyltransferase [Candidatus Parcubacteria bacterium]
MKILFTGGGTGGHIFPIIAVLREIKKIRSKEPIDFFYIGPKDNFQNFLFKEGVKIKNINTGKIRRYWGIKSFFQNLADIFFRIPFGIFQAFWYIFALNPDLIFSKGGFGSLPAVISGWILRVPIFLQESDVSAGFANRILSRFCLEIFVAFPVEKTTGLPAQKMISTGNPIRTKILEVKKEEAKQALKLTNEKPVILILGGSQGAQRINDNILEILPEFLKDFEVIHQCGTKNFQGIKAELKIIVPKQLEKYYHLYPFLDDKNLANAYNAADAVVSRAGSGSIFEISALGKPSILIPLEEAAQNHQLKNAYCYSETGASIVIEEPNFTPHFFLAKLKNLFSDHKRIKNMSAKAKKFSRPKAAQIIAGYIIEYLNQ